jgi:hypothetical protein
MGGMIRIVNLSETSCGAWVEYRHLGGEARAWRDRVAYAEYWEAEFKAMEAKFRHLAETDFRLYKAMQEWHNRIA